MLLFFIIIHRLYHIDAKQLIHITNTLINFKVKFEVLYKLIVMLIEVIPNYLQGIHVWKAEKLNKNIHYRKRINFV